MRKINKTFNQKNVYCVWRRPIDASKHTKSFLRNLFLLVFGHAHDKYISRFLTQQFDDITQ